MAITARQRLAANLRIQRLLRGWSQEALAQAAGLHRSYVGGIECGRRNVSLDNIERLAVALALAPAELLREPDPRHLGEQMLGRFRAPANDAEPGAAERR